MNARSTDDAVENICDLNWGDLSKDSLTSVAWAYHYFSIQFRENLEIARALSPDDESLKELEAEECRTANLSPWEGVAMPGERMDHDEFMRRTLTLAPIGPERCVVLCAHGRAYLDAVRSLDAHTRAQSIVSYEGGGLERVFCAMLGARDWQGPLLSAFRHFLAMHLKLDDHHGALVGHLDAGEAAVPLWQLFRDLLVACVPDLVSRPVDSREMDRFGASPGATALVLSGLPLAAA
ncbi:MAG TPA: hypothetical protein VGL35_04295 [Rhizomicrobium sp.]